MKKLLYLSIVCLINITLLWPANASQSMRRCMLLPVQDTIGGAISFKVFEEIEKYLKDSEWCYYKSNSEILNILGRYKRNFNEHLENVEVLKLISQKTHSGSLIKVEIKGDVRGIEVGLKIIGDSGEDLYFKENKLILLII